MKFLRSGNDWLFGYGSPYAMGVFRAVFCFVVFVTLALTAIDFNAWYTEVGFVPIAQMQRWNGGMPIFTLLGGVTEAWVTATFYGLTMLAALLTSVGLWARASSIALLVGVTSIHLRSPDILHSGDTLVRVMLLYVALAPSGASFSLDRWIARRKGAVDEIPVVSLWPQRMMQLQLAIVYVTTVWHKSFGDTWLNGTATWYPAQLQEFDRFPVPGWFDQQPMLAVTTWGTLLIELALGTLVFSKPFRKWVLLGGVALHAGIEYRFNIPMFAFIITSSYIVFYQGEEVLEWMKRVQARLVRKAVLVGAREEL